MIFKKYEITDSQEVAETEQRGQCGGSRGFAHGFRCRRLGPACCRAGLLSGLPPQRGWAEGAAGEAAPLAKQEPPPAPCHRPDGMAGWSPVCCFPGLPPPGPLPGDGGFSYSFLGGLPTPSASLGAGLSQSGPGVHEGAHRHAVLSPGPRPRASSPWFRAALSVCVSV